MVASSSRKINASFMGGGHFTVGKRGPTRLPCFFFSLPLAPVPDLQQPNELDPIWKWSTDGNNLASSAYHAFFSRATSLLGAEELWRTKASPRVKFFF